MNLKVGDIVIVKSTGMGGTIVGIEGKYFIVAFDDRSTGKYLPDELESYY